MLWYATLYFMLDRICVLGWVSNILKHLHGKLEDITQGGILEGQLRELLSLNEFS